MESADAVLWVMTALGSVGAFLMVVLALAVPAEFVMSMWLCWLCLPLLIALAITSALKFARTGNHNRGRVLLFIAALPGIGLALFIAVMFRQ